MFPVPVPSRFHDRAQLGIARLPAQLALDFIRAGDQDGRIAVAAWPFLNRHGFSRDLLGGLNHFPDAVALANAQVVAQAIAGLQLLQSEQMSLGEIVDVNIVANAGAVRSWIIGAVNLDMRSPSQDGLQNERDQMGLRVVVFANGSIGAGAGGLEIA